MSKCLECGEELVTMEELKLGEGYCWLHGPGSFFRQEQEKQTGNLAEKDEWKCTDCDAKDNATHHATCPRKGTGPAPKEVKTS